MSSTALLSMYESPELRCSTSRMTSKNTDMHKRRRDFLNKNTAWQTFFTLLFTLKKLILLKTHFEQIFLFPVFHRTVSIFQQNSFNFSTEQFQCFKRKVILFKSSFQQNCQIVKLRFQQICVNNFQQNSF